MKLDIKKYWTGYAWYVYFNIGRKLFRLRFIPRFNTYSKDRRRLIVVYIGNAK